MTTSFARAESLRRECERLLRDLSQALERALMAYQEPKGAAAPFLATLARLERDAEAHVRTNPSAKEYLNLLLGSTRREAEKLVAKAQRAHDARPKVEGRFQQAYNGVVGPTLSRLPGQGTQALKGQVEAQVRRLVDQLMPQQVTGDAKGVMARELSRWILEQSTTEDAFFVVERTLGHVARFLHEKLTIHGELVTLKTQTASRPTITTDEARTADERAGQLAKRSQELDRLIAQTIEQQALSIRTHVRLNPRLVLDPTRRYLERLDAAAGITIKKDQVRVDLGVRLQVTNPLMLDNTTQVGAAANLGVQVGNDLHINASYGGNVQNGRWGNEQFKVSLSWRF
jgi:hypothetical protein